MSANAAPFGTTREGDWVYGPWRAPVNISAAAEGTIHDDATAQALGLRRGTVAGSIHMEQMVPMAVAVLGDAWLQHGSLSIYFHHATGDGEQVRCRAAEPDGASTTIEMHTPEGALVCEGVASLGPPPARGPLRDRLQRAIEKPAAPLRILADIGVGDTVTHKLGRMARTRVDTYAPGVTEQLAMFAEQPRGLPMNLAIDVLRADEPHLLRARGPFVGLYGAIEVEFLAGPLREETDYFANGRVLALAETPQTEVAWRETTLADARGAPVARMIMMTRLMKASSPLWA
jgi:hypothetical protein